MLRSIELKNFKCFESTVINLRPLTLLTGQNASGKSSVIQAILALRQSALQHMIPGAGLVLNGPLVELGTAQAVLFDGAQSDDISFILESDNGRIAAHFKYTANESSPTSGDADVLPQHPGKASHWSTNVVDSPRFHYLSAERIGPRALHLSSSYAVRQERSLGSDARFAVAFFAAHRSDIVEMSLRLAGSLDATLESQVTGWMNEIVPGVRFFLHEYPDLNRVTLGIGFASPGSPPSEYRAPNVGFGVSYVFGVVVAALAAEPGSLVIIENPEAHLHPRGQFALGKLIACAANAGIQMLVETHSDHVLNGVRLAVKQALTTPDTVVVHYFDRLAVNEQLRTTVQTPSLDRNGRFDKWPAGFFDQWESSLDALLEN